MKKIILFKIDFFREKFSVINKSSIIAFITTILLIVIGLRLLIDIITDKDMNYLMYSLIGSFLFYTIGGHLIYKRDIEKKLLSIRTFFTSLDIEKFRYIELFKGYIMYMLLYFFMFFPFNNFNIYRLKIYSVLFVALNILLCINSFFYAKSRIDLIKSATSIASTLIVVITIVVGRNFDFTKWDFLLEDNILYIIWAISIFIIYLNIKNIKKHNENIFEKKYIIKYTGRIKNKDMLYIIREGKYFEPMMIVLFSLAYSFLFRESVIQLSYTNMISFSYSYIFFFTQIISYEKSSYPLIYGPNEHGKFKSEKIINVIKINLMFLFIVFIPMALVTNILSVIFAFASSTIIFLIITILFKFNFQKRLGYKEIISDKNILIYYAISLSIHILIVISLDIY